MSSTPTQVRRPWRATVRTIFALVVGLATSWSVFVQVLGLDPTWQWVAIGSAAAGFITRVMADPRVEALLRRFVPWLAADRDDAGAIALRLVELAAGILAGLLIALLLVSLL